MSYYSCFRLDAPPDAIAFLRAHNDEAEDAIDENGAMTGLQAWYDHEKDVAALSRGFPQDLIVLHGEGEDSPDLWRIYFRAGASQRVEAVISYPECTLEPPPPDLEAPPEIKAWRERQEEKRRLRARLAELDAEDEA